jgi:hypothetical protein
MADSQFLLRNETHQIIGSTMEVLNEVGLLINFKHRNWNSNASFGND